MISDEHKAVFVHIPKTGGSTIESIFSHNLITTTGGFSELMKKISNALPPDLLE